MDQQGQPWMPTSLSPDELLASMIQDSDAVDPHLTEFPGFNAAAGAAIGQMPQASTSSLFDNEDQYSIWSSNAVQDWRSNTVSELGMQASAHTEPPLAHATDAPLQERPALHPHLMFDPSNVARIATPFTEEEESAGTSFYGFQPDAPVYHRSRTRSESEFSAHSAASNTDATLPESLHTMSSLRRHDSDGLHRPPTPERLSPEYLRADGHCYSPAELFLLGNSGRESAFASGASTPSIATSGTGTSTPLRANNSASPTLLPNHHPGNTGVGSHHGHQSKFGHMVINAQGKRAHQCYYCDKQFTTSGHLARHCRIHTGERKFHCPFDGCGALFARRDNCATHLKKHFLGKYDAPDALDAQQAESLLHYQNLLKEQHVDPADNTALDELPRPYLERSMSAASQTPDSPSVSPALQPPSPDAHPQPAAPARLRRRASLHHPLTRASRSASSRSSDDLLMGLQRHHHHHHAHVHGHASPLHAHVAPSQPISSPMTGGAPLPHHHQQPHAKPAPVQAGGVRKPAHAERPSAGGGARSRSLSRATSRSRKASLSVQHTPLAVDMASPQDAFLAVTSGMSGQGAVLPAENQFELLLADTLAAEGDASSMGTTPLDTFMQDDNGQSVSEGPFGFEQVMHADLKQGYVDS